MVVYETEDTMTTRLKAPAPERVFCEVCLKDIPRSEAAMSEARDYVAFFCGLECYEKWAKDRAAAPPPESAAALRPEPELQVGHGRSKLRDERLKRALTQHPQRDTDKVEG